MTTHDFAAEQRALATAWKKRTPTLGFANRGLAPWINQDGVPIGEFSHCLNPDQARDNLLPDAHGSVDLFTELGIPWHGGVDGGPGNNLLSSQVQCVNASCR